MKITDLPNRSISYLTRKIDYLFKPVDQIFDYDSFKAEQQPHRILQDIHEGDYHKELILTTYFNTKPNPQNKANVSTDDFSYIEDFYNSVKKHRLHAVIFYDNLSTAFVESYSSEHIRFVKCRILKYSLNDERFFIYQEFLKSVRPDKIIMSDVNDVTFGVNPFPFIRQDVFYIGRDHHHLTNHSEWLKKKIALLPEDLQKRIPSLFYTMPLLNAGVIGGDSVTVSNFISKVVSLLSYADNDLNHNMACVNIAFFDAFWIRHYKNTFVKIKYLKSGNLQKLESIATVTADRFYIGRPFVSQFWKFEKDSGCYIYHK